MTLNVYAYLFPDDEDRRAPQSTRHSGLPHPNAEKSDDLLGSTSVAFRPGGMR
jgi:hypothetical protein